MDNTIAISMNTKSGIYYKAERGMRLPASIFEYRGRTIRLLISLDDGSVYAGIGFTATGDAGYMHHGIFADEVGIPPGIEFDKLVRPGYRDGVLTYNGVWAGVPVDVDVMGWWDTVEFGCLALNNIIRASKMLVRVGLSKSMPTVYRGVTLSLGEFAR